MGIYKEVLLILILQILNLTGGECARKTFNGRERMDHRFDELSEQSKGSPIIQMNTRLLKDYINGPARNYSVIVSYRLVGYKIPPLIHELYGYFNTIAYSYSQGLYDKNIFFVTVYDNSEVQRLCSENDMNLLPLIIHYPTVGGYLKSDLFDLRWSSPTLQSLLQFVKIRTKTDIKLKKDVNITSLLMMFVSIGFLGFLAYYFQDLLFKLNNKKVWAISSVLFITLMFSGHMLNRINRSPFIGPQGLMNPDVRQQYGAESFALFTLYLSVIVALVMINDIRNSRNSEKQGSSVQKMFHIGYELFVVSIFCGSIFLLFKFTKFKLPWYPLFP